MMVEFVSAIVSSILLLPFSLLVKLFIYVLRDMKDWPLVAPLPSYGRGRDEPGPRYSNFIAGSNLTDVIITGTYLLRHVRIR